MLETQVLIIGGGATGTGIARDLALRGVNCLLVEKEDINAGASGGNHGLLHSGARYVFSDIHAAFECWSESSIIKEVASCCVEKSNGYFVAVEGDDDAYIADFPNLCEKSGIPYKKVDIEEAKENEPALSDKTIAVYEVEDAAIDPFKLSLENMSQACELGSTLLCHHKVSKINVSNNSIASVEIVNTKTGETKKVVADHIVNASGAWAGTIAQMAGAPLDMIYSKGTLLVTDTRVTNRVINRLRKASDADILVPGGTVSILGTTSQRVDSPDNIYPTVGEVDFIVQEGAAMIPSLESTRFIRAYSGVRPLVQGSGNGGDRDVSRGFSLIDHETDGLNNFTTITGGKLTTYRLMAEKTVDLICNKMGVEKPCLTKIVPISSSDFGKWTEPGLSPKLWLSGEHKGDSLLCECEMVSRKVVDRIVDSIREHNEAATLKAVGLRSRIGKGPCQGSFCGPRIAAYMYNEGYLKNDQAIYEFRDFFNERWKGQHSVSWDVNLARAELHEALQCGMFGLELQ